MYIVVTYDSWFIGSCGADVDVVDYLYYGCGSLHLRDCYGATVLDYRSVALCTDVISDTLLNAPYDYMSKVRYDGFGAMSGCIYKPTTRSFSGVGVRYFYGSWFRSSYVFAHPPALVRGRIYPYYVRFYEHDSDFLWSFNVGLIVFKHIGLYHVWCGGCSFISQLFAFCRAVGMAFELFMGSDLYVSFRRDAGLDHGCRNLSLLWSLYGVGEGVILKRKASATRRFRHSGQDRRKLGRYMSYSRVSCSGIYKGEDSTKKTLIRYDMVFYILDRALFGYFDEGGVEVSDGGFRDFGRRHRNLLCDVLVYLMLGCSPMFAYMGSYDRRLRSLYTGSEGVRVMTKPVVSGFYPDNVGYSSFYDILGYWVTPFSSSFYFGFFSRYSSYYMFAGVFAGVAALPVLAKSLVMRGLMEFSRFYGKVMSLAAYAFQLRSVAVYSHFNRKAKKAGSFKCLNLPSGVVYFPFGLLCSFRIAFTTMVSSNFIDRRLLGDHYYVNFMSDLMFLFATIRKGGLFDRSLFYYYMSQVRSVYCGGQVVYGNGECGNLVKGAHYSFVFPYPVLKERWSVYVTPFLIKFAVCLMFYINVIVVL